MDYKEVTRRMYDIYAKKFEEMTKGQMKNISYEIQLFASRLNGKRVLDLGCGPGRDSLYFQQRGLVPLCFDISRGMLKLCRDKGLEVMLGDMEKLPFSDNSFDGVWACASLLHVPREKLFGVLEKISKILVPKGIFYISVKEGVGQGYIKSDKYPRTKRFFAFYTDEEARQIISQTGFTITESRRNPVGEAVFLNYIARNEKS
jgi:ubiquinone/menaquinone biosynthesis C-methylase UbiE